MESWGQDMGRFQRRIFQYLDAKSDTVNVTAKNEPWVHAKHVTQCFFITDPNYPSRVVVRRGKRNIVGIDGVANEEDYNQ